MQLKTEKAFNQGLLVLKAFLSHLYFSKTETTINGEWKDCGMLDGN
jgi:hypothetical protein